jgi:hypothetical protein
MQSLCKTNANKLPIKVWFCSQKQGNKNAQNPKKITHISL